jgi:hypothetical protein
MISKRSRGLLVAVAVTLAIGAGVAWAAIPDASGVIQACYKTSNGALRAVPSASSCSASETPIELGGPTRGHSVGDPADATLGTSSTSILELGLPAGKYLIHAKANLINLPGSDAAFVACDLRLASTTTELDAVRVVLEEHATSSEAYQANVPLQAAVTLTAPSAVVFECAALTRGTTSTVNARYRQLAAVSLDTLS